MSPGLWTLAVSWEVNETQLSRECDECVCRTDTIWTEPWAGGSSAEGKGEGGDGKAVASFRGRLWHQRAQWDKLQAKRAACTKAQTEKGPLVEECTTPLRLETGNDTRQKDVPEMCLMN